MTFFLLQQMVFHFLQCAESKKTSCFSVALQIIQIMFVAGIVPFSNAGQES